MKRIGPLYLVLRSLLDQYEVYAYPVIDSLTRRDKLKDYFPFTLEDSGELRRNIKEPTAAKPLWTRKHTPHFESSK
jgi:hypothetical protein